MENSNEKLQAFDRILTIMNELREKCPWDMKQTLETLSPLTIEEVYELNDAIGNKDIKGIKEEIGDLLLHIVFYAKIGEEQGHFDIASVINALCEKLIHRHPHIYGDVKVTNEEDVKQNWEKLKLKEGKTSVLGGVPRSLPAMLKAVRIQDKVKQVGFEWSDEKDVWNKVEEEIGELQEALQNAKAGTGAKEKVEDEFGDVLFSLINYARFIDVNPDAALERTNKKFMGRFLYMEQKAKDQNKKLEDMTLAEMDEWWNEAKKK
jgi:XTP/dITP diphosphohydrolase